MKLSNILKGVGGLMIAIGELLGFLEEGDEE